jgi:hypothetical protein
LRSEGHGEGDESDDWKSEPWEIAIDDDTHFVRSRIGFRRTVIVKMRV